MYKITVLMSTYNGERYIKEQIDSILNQEDVEVFLYVRDDGSNDRTRDILDDYAKNNYNVKWYSGENLRPAKSFMDLVFNAPDSEYYAFADQDDYWLPRKLISGIEKINEGYVLYTGCKYIVDSNLISMNKADEYVRALTLGAAILKCNVSGCTMVFGRELLEKVREYNPKVISMHDSWVLKVATCMGEVYYDKNRYILYRQHDNNVVGSELGAITKWKKRFSEFNTRKHNLDRIYMAKELYREYSKYLSSRDRKMLYHFANSRNSVKSRFKVVFSKFLFTQKKYEIIAVKILVLIGMI